LSQENADKATGAGSEFHESARTNEWRQMSPEEETQINYQNIALGFTLFGFCAAVYKYSTSQVHKSPEEEEINALNTELLREESTSK
jgi:hypothetical protein